MATIFDKNFIDFLNCLNKKNARFILVGGLASVIHGVNRVTGDMDIYIDATTDNAQKVLDAIKDFGFGSIGFTTEDLLNADIVVQMGREPLRIDILCDLPGLIFKDAFENAIKFETEGVQIKVIHITDLIRNKELVGREKDKMDVNVLKKKLKAKK